MDNITAALKEALEKGSSFDDAIREIIRKQVEKATNDILRASRKHIQWVKEDDEERFLVNLASDYNLRRWKGRVKCWRYLNDPLEKRWFA